MWLIEALMIIGGTLAAGLALKERSFFCPECECWSMTSFESPPLAFETEIEPVIAALKNHDYTVLDKALAADPKSHHYRATIIYCPTCKRGILDLVDIWFPVGIVTMRTLTVSTWINQVLGWTLPDWTLTSKVQVQISKSRNLYTRFIKSGSCGLPA